MARFKAQLRGLVQSVASGRHQPLLQRSIEACAIVCLVGLAVVVAKNPGQLPDASEGGLSKPDTAAFRTESGPLQTLAL